MKKIAIICFVSFWMGLITGPALAANYAIDYLEPGNAGGWGTSLKTFDEVITVAVDQVFFVDIWMNADSSYPDPDGGGFYIDFTGNADKLIITDIEKYNNQSGELPGPWEPFGMPDAIGPVQSIPDGAALSTVASLAGAPLDTDEAIIVARVGFVCNGIAPASVTLTISDDAPASFAYWGPLPWDDALIPDETFIITIVPEICDGVDNDLDGLTDEAMAERCGNGVDDDCDGSTDEGLCADITYCEPDFDCDGAVDSDDTPVFQSDYGRFLFSNPCTDANPCNGDFNCDGAVDSNDTPPLQEDYGRWAFSDPCPTPAPGAWCNY